MNEHEFNQIDCELHIVNDVRSIAFTTYRDDFTKNYRDDIELNSIDDVRDFMNKMHCLIERDLIIEIIDFERVTLRDVDRKYYACRYRFTQTIENREKYMQYVMRTLT